MNRHERTITTRPAATMPPPTTSAPGTYASGYVATPPPAPVAVDAVRDVSAGRTVTRRRFVPASAPGAILGIALLVLGGVALARAGTDNPFSDPTVDVLGWAHNAPLAVAEMAAGLLLLVVSLSGVRGAILFFSALTAVGGIVFAIEPDAVDRFVIERSLAITIAVAAGVVMLLAAIMPTVVRSTDHIAEERVIID